MSTDTVQRLPAQSPAQEALTSVENLIGSVETFRDKTGVHEMTSIGKLSITHKLRTIAADLAELQQRREREVAEVESCQCGAQCARKES